MSFEEVRPIEAPFDTEGLEFAAAAIELAFREPEERPLPEALRAKVLLQAQAYYSDAAKSQSSESSEISESAAKVVSFPTAARRPLWGHPALGWAVAAVLLAMLILPSSEAPSTAPDDSSVVPGESVSIPQVEASPQDLRAELLGLEGTLQVEWAGTEDPVAESATGDVVWHGGLQKGFLRFAGLEANDPSEYQYQLWIFDALQDERYPVDGGVFDIPGKDGIQETLIPIDPKIAVQEPTLFAVTVEKPGGVVVSSRERIVLVGSVG